MEKFNDIINADKPTLVDFFATWCGPCQAQIPILSELKEEIGGKATILKIDVDKNQELAMQYRVMSVPTLIIFKSGEVIWREFGLHDKDSLKKG
ncbi:MAG: thioredoxin [Muribaculaceae bacterium]